MPARFKRDKITLAPRSRKSKIGVLQTGEITSGKMIRPYQRLFAPVEVELTFSRTCIPSPNSLRCNRRQIAWMIFCLVCAGLMIVLARAFYHQLLDPNYGRTQQQPNGFAPSHAYRMDGINQEQQTSSHVPYGGPPPLANPFAPGNLDHAPDYNAPPMYVPPEKGSAYESFNAAQNERKDSMVDVRMDDAASPHDRDLAGQMEALTQRRSNDSDDTIQGRKGEGRI